MSSTDMVDHSVAVVDQGPLEDKEYQDLERLLAELDQLADLYCTGCEYCMPCPHNVSISRRFQLMNQHRVWGCTEQARTAYQRLLARDAEGECQECGECLPKCPQDIAIIDQLKETHAVLG